MQALIALTRDRTRGTYQRAGAILIGVWLLTMAACVGPARPSGQQETVVVGGKAFPESRLLGEMMAVMIEANTDLRVKRRMNLGGTMIAFSALAVAEIDLYAEYTGTGLVDILKEPLGHERTSEAVYRQVKQLFEQRYDLVWLEPFGFDNAYALAVRPDLGITKISQLAELRNRVRARFQPEFLQRPDGYAGLAQHYRFTLADVKGMEHGLAYQALHEGQIDVMDAYTTDGLLHKYQLVLLEDDKHFFPPYDCAPLMRREILQRHPDLQTVLGKLAGRISSRRMVGMNYQLSVERRSAEWVAQNFLREEGLIPSTGPLANHGQMTVRRLARLMGEHLVLTLVATGLAALCGLGLGLLVARHPKFLAGPVLGAAGVIQTVPSLAMLAFMLALLEVIGKPPAIAALFLYALLPIVRNTYTGISSVPAELIEAGTAMGMTRRQLMFTVELPLATKTIMAGIRTALVISVGTATLGAFISAGGLGEPIAEGLQNNDHRLILWGAIPAAILALACDFGMGWLEAALGPRGLPRK